MRVSSASLVVPFAISFALFASSTRADPTIDIRSRGVLELHGARVGEGVVRVRAILTDDVGAPIRGGRVRITARRDSVTCGSPRVCATTEDGTCQATIEGCDAREVVGHYEGSDSTDPADVVAPVVDHRSEPRVRVTVGDGVAVDLDARSVRVVVAIDDVASAPARVSLADELGRVIVHRAISGGATTGLDLAPRDLGPPGLGSLIATVRFEDGTDASGRVMIARRTRARLVLARDGDALVARLTDGFGPVEGAIIGLRIDDAPASDARTDSAGRARFALEPREEDAIARATFHSNDGARTDADSNPIRIRPTGRPWARLILPFVSLAILGAFVIRRSTRARPVPTHDETRVESPVVEVGEASGILPSHTDVGLRIVAREDDRPLDAIARFESGVAEFARGADGRLVLSTAPNGTHSVVVEAHGRAPETVRLRIPHRGEWSNAVVRLETARAHARRAVPIVARAAARADDEGETLTVREADDRLHGTTDVSFREDAEDAIYGADEPSIEHAQAIVSRSRARANRPAGA